MLKRKKSYLEWEFISHFTRRIEELTARDRNVRQAFIII